jgi:hypothetical protein
MDLSELIEVFPILDDLDQPPIRKLSIFCFPSRDSRPIKILNGLLVR